jgi:3-methylcrotonyl-CoA carboxylase beta subunit
MWPNSRISVMGGEQAAQVLSQVIQDKKIRQKTSWDEQEKQTYMKTIRQQYESQGNPYYASARLWDDGIIDPLDTRKTLALAISASLNAPIPETNYGIFRM